MICINDDKMIFIYGSFCDMNAASCVRARVPNLRRMTPFPESLQAEVWWCIESIISIINICSLCVLCNISGPENTHHMYIVHTFFCCWFAFLRTSCIYIYIFSRFQPCSLTQRNPSIYQDMGGQSSNAEGKGEHWWLRKLWDQFSNEKVHPGWVVWRHLPSGCFEIVRKDTKRYGTLFKI